MQQTNLHLFINITELIIIIICMLVSMQNFLLL